MQQLWGPMCVKRNNIYEVLIRLSSGRTNVSRYVHRISLKRHAFKPVQTDATTSMMLNKKAVTAGAAADRELRKF